MKRKAGTRPWEEIGKDSGITTRSEMFMFPGWSTLPEDGGGTTHGGVVLTTKNPGQGRGKCLKETKGGA